MEPLNMGREFAPSSRRPVAKANMKPGNVEAAQPKPDVKVPPLMMVEVDIDGSNLSSHSDSDHRFDNEGNDRPYPEGVLIDLKKQDTWHPDSF